MQQHNQQHWQIEAGHPALAGHFPGNPIVPAALLLGLVEQQLQLVVPDHYLARIRRVKFAAMVHPGDRLTFTADVDMNGDNKVTFTLRSQRGQVLQGRGEMQRVDPRQAEVALDGNYR